MGRKLKDGEACSKPREPYRSARLSSGGIVHQIGRDTAVFNVWGNKLAMFQSSSTAGIAWLSARRWLSKHPEAGELVEASQPAALEDIMAWIKTRRSLYEDLDDNQRQIFEAACKREITDREGIHG
jgi:hypothetical protein